LRGALDRCVRRGGDQVPGADSPGTGRAFSICFMARIVMQVHRQSLAVCAITLGQETLKPSG